MLRRRKLVFAAALLIGISAAMIFIAFAQPLYTARAVVLSEDKAINMNSVAPAVVKRLNLMTDSEFNPRFRYVDEGKRAADRKTKTGFKKLSVYGSELESLPPALADSEVGDVITRFLSRLDVRPVGGSYAIEIEFTSEDAAKAALIANKIADVFIAQRTVVAPAANQELTRWFEERLSYLKDRLEESEKAVADYKARFDISDGAQAAADEDQSSELQDELEAARKALVEAEARVSRGKSEEEVKIEGELAKLSERYGPKHPKIIALQAELNEIRGAGRQEKDKIADEVKTAKARVKALEEKASETADAAEDGQDVMAGLAALEREEGAARLVYDTFAEAYTLEAQALANVQTEASASPAARVLSYAAQPRSASYPNKVYVFALSVLASLLAGVGVAALLEVFDNSFRSAGQLEKAFSYPCFALIPKAAGQNRTELADYILSKPASPVAESVKTLRTVLNLRARKDGEKPRVICVTSSVAGEGKTLLSVWLGRMTAKSKEKVIIIDADLRKPDLHRSIGRSNDVSLVDYLTDKKKLEQVIQKDDASGAHMIYGRSVPNSALDLVSSDKMRKLVSSLGQVYDLVVIDTPSCHGVSDARVIAGMSDQVIYAVEWNVTPREDVMAGLKPFADTGHQALAFVLTKVDMRRK